MTGEIYNVLVAENEKLRLEMEQIQRLAYKAVSKKRFNVPESWEQILRHCQVDYIQI